MSWHWVVAARKIPDLSPAQASVIAAIADAICPEEGRGWQSIAETMRQTRFSARNVRRRVAELVELGVLTADRKGGRGKSPEYRIAAPEAVAEAARRIAEERRKKAANLSEKAANLSEKAANLSPHPEDPDLSRDPPYPPSGEGSTRAARKAASRTRKPTHDERDPVPDDDSVEARYARYKAAR